MNCTDPISNSDKQAGTFEQINDATITERGWEMMQALTPLSWGSLFFLVKIYTGSCGEDGLAENLDLTTTSTSR